MRLDQHQFARELRQTGYLLHEVVLVEAVRSGFRVELRVGLRPATGPVAGQPDSGDPVGPALVHRTLYRALKPAVDAGFHVAGFHVNPGPMIVGGRFRDRFHQPDIVVVDVHQAGDDAAIFRKLAGIDVMVAAGPGFDRLPAAHVLHPERGHDRLQALGVDRVVVELRPGCLAARHEVPAVKVEDQRSRSCRPRNVIEVGHDAQHAQAAVLLDQRHGIGVRGEQDLFVLRRAVVLARQIGDDGFAGVALRSGPSASRWPSCPPSRPPAPSRRLRDRE